MKTHFNPTRLLLGFVATSLFAALGAVPSMSSGREVSPEVRPPLTRIATSSAEQLVADPDVVLVQETRFYNERRYYDGRRYYGRRNYYSPYRYRAYYYYGPGYNPAYIYPPLHGYYYEYRYGPPDYRPYFQYHYFYDGPGVRIYIGPQGYYYRYQ